MDQPACPLYHFLKKTVYIIGWLQQNKNSLFFLNSQREAAISTGSMLYTADL